MRQGCSRFVHDDNTGINGKGTGNRDKVFVCDPEIAQTGVGRERCADAVQQFGCCALHFRCVYQAKSCAGGMADKDVLGDGQLVEQNSLLVDCGDARLARCVSIRECNWCTVDADGAAVRVINACQDFHGCRFARPVFADQRRHLTRVKIKPDMHPEL